MLVPPLLFCFVPFSGIFCFNTLPLKYSIRYIPFPVNPFFWLRFGKDARYTVYFHQKSSHRGAFRRILNIFCFSSGARGCEIFVLISSFFDVSCCNCKIPASQRRKIFSGTIFPYNFCKIFVKFRVPAFLGTKKLFLSLNAAFWQMTQKSTLLLSTGYAFNLCI